MKKLITLLLPLIIIISLCACGKNDNSSMTQGNSSTPQISSEKGTISNPYSINDTIEFTAYQPISRVYYMNGKRTADFPSTFRFTDLKIHDEVEFEFSDPDPLNKLLIFTLEIVDSSVNTPIDLTLDYSIGFATINDKGVSDNSMVFLPRDVYETMNINDFWDLHLLPGFSTKCGTILYNSDGGNLSLISLCYVNETGELAYIYIDPSK